MARAVDDHDDNEEEAPPTQSSRSQGQKQGGQSEMGCCGILTTLIQLAGMVILYVCYWQPHYMIMSDMDTYLAKLDAANPMSNLRHQVEHISGSVYYGHSELCTDVNIQWRHLNETEHKLPHVESCVNPRGFKYADAVVLDMLQIMSAIGNNLIGVAMLISGTECVCCVKSVVIKNRLRLLTAVMFLAGGNCSFLPIAVLWCSTALGDAHYDWLNYEMNLDYPRISSVTRPFDANMLFQKDWASILQLIFGLLITVSWSRDFEIYRKALTALRKKKNREISYMPLENIISDTPSTEI